MIYTLVSLLFMHTTQNVQVITIGYILVFLRATQNQASCVKRQCILFVFGRWIVHISVATPAVLAGFVWRVSSAPGSKFYNDASN